MPSRNSLHACSNISSASPSRWSVYAIPGRSFASSRLSFALRFSNGSSRQSSPFSSRRSNAYNSASSLIRCACKRAKSAIPSSPRTTHSPPRTIEETRSALTASTIWGKRSVQSYPRLVNTRTRLSARRRPQFGVRKPEQLHGNVSLPRGRHRDTHMSAPGHKTMSKDTLVKDSHPGNLARCMSAGANWDC